MADDNREPETIPLDIENLHAAFNATKSNEDVKTVLGGLIVDWWNGQQPEVQPEKIDFRARLPDGTCRKILDGLSSEVELDQIFSAIRSCGMRLRVGTTQAENAPFCERDSSMESPLAGWFEELVSESRFRLSNPSSIERFGQDQQLHRRLNQNLSDRFAGNRRVRILCSGHQWRIGEAWDYFSANALLATQNRVDIERIVVDDGSTTSRILAGLSARAGVQTRLLDASLIKKSEDFFLKAPLEGIGLWICGDKRVVVHREDGAEHTYESTDDLPLVHFLYDTVYNRLRDAAIPITDGMSLFEQATTDMSRRLL